jgi:telomere length regulation protein
MVAGVALSRLVDPPDKVVKFNLEGLGFEDSQWWLSLVSVEDGIGSIRALCTQQSKSENQKQMTEANVQGSSARKEVSKTSSNQGVQKLKIVAIEELSDGEDSDDKIMAYEKPDSDAEDSEDDPTLIQRNKPTAPVFVVPSIF